MSNLHGKHAVVTGASRGLGKAIASHLAQLGANLALLARSEDALEALAQDLSSSSNGNVVPVPCDISDVPSIRRAHETIADHMPNVDVLVNNVGIPAPRTMEDTTFEEWEHVTNVNLSGAFYMTRGLWGLLMAEPGSYVVNVSGVAGRRGSSSPAYASSKFGLTGFTRSLAISGEEQGLRATVLYVGSMDTGWRGAAIGERPRREVMDPDEVARFIGYLVTSPEAVVVNEAVMNPIGARWS